MSDPFSTVLPPRRKFSDQTLLDEVRSGRLDRTLARAVAGTASDEMLEALIKAFVASYPKPENYLSQICLDPFSLYFIAESQTGVIHRGQINQAGLFGEALLDCQNKAGGFNHVLPGRFSNPADHQSRCPDCNNKVNLALAEAESAETVSFADLASASLEEAASEEGWQTLMNKDFQEETLRRAEITYWSQQGLAGGKDVIVGIIGEDDYDYFEKQIGRAPETVISEQDWVDLYPGRAPIKLCQALIYLLIEKVDNA